MIVRRTPKTIIKMVSFLFVSGGEVVGDAVVGGAIVCGVVVWSAVVRGAIVGSAVVGSKGCLPEIQGHY